MFVDKVKVEVKAGDGGNGIVNFRHEKFIDKGGPDGGDGGDGGSVILVASRNQNTLVAFRFQRLITATNGAAGFKQKMHGKNGEDLRVEVPVGTVVLDAEDQPIADLADEGEEVVIAKGGKGGFGNAHFTSSTRQTPRVAEKGEPGEAMKLTFELKVIAEVGLVGLPNAGKSTLLATISNAKPEIANYPFTTLVPNLGVVDIDDTSLVVADIPGLIEGASLGKGLGDEFLRHVERTRILLHLIDAYSDSLADAFNTIQAELAAYKIDLSKKPQIVALTKIDGLDQEIVDDQIKELRKTVPKNIDIVAISSKSKAGMKDLLRTLNKEVKKQRAHDEEVAEEEQETNRVPVLRLQDDLPWRVERTDDGFMITGAKIERFAKRTDFDDFHSTQRLRDIMKKMGIMHELKRQRLETDQVITISKYGSFTY